MNDSKFTLFYFPTSYYSQKVLIALKEKNVRFQLRMVNILNLEQTQAWYMRMNASGTVPVLKDGDKIVKESEDIINYVDRAIPGDVRLVPGTESEMGRQVEKFRKLMDKIPIDKVTYGIFFNNELSAPGGHIPPPFRQSRKDLEAKILKGAVDTAKLAERHLDLRDAYLTKSQLMSDRLNFLMDKSRVEEVLDDLEKTCDVLEEQLKKMKIEQSDETWLCGPNYTAADLTLTCLLGRLIFVGLGERYFPKEKRPNLWAYWGRTQQRSSTREVVLGAGKFLAKYIIQEKAKCVLPVIGGLATVGLAAGLAAFLIHKYK
ncbi:ganglioside-induced differentiation-associated protein 1-like [Haliotis cracherodii]|uniref:ganglioside-induced differentiation-associated protein 1-like n=1 Tax=Haliotis cracherodii TaxID=6455 RepID=UPI0039ECBE63